MAALDVPAVVVGRIRGYGRRLALAGLDLAGRAMVYQIRHSISTAFPPPSAPWTPPHRRTGTLSGSIRYYVDRTGLVLHVVAGAPYSSFLEFGTSRMAPRPFLRRGLLGLAVRHGAGFFRAGGAGIGAGAGAGGAGGGGGGGGGDTYRDVILGAEFPAEEDDEDQRRHAAGGPP
jgi:hypothetical protein